VNLHKLSKPGAGMSDMPAQCSVDRCYRHTRMRVTMAGQPVRQDPPPPVSGIARPAAPFVLCHTHAREWRETWDRRGLALDAAEAAA